MKKHFKLSLLVFILASISGCTQYTFVKLEGQSHYTEQNSDITLLGRVHGESTSYGVAPFSNPWVDSKLKLEAINNALDQKPEATFLINTAHIQKTTLYPSPLFGLFSVTKIIYQVDGQAAKQTQ